MTDDPSRVGFIPPRPAQQVSNVPPIPVAIPYFSDDADASMLPLVRVLAVLIVITAALKLIAVPTFLLGTMSFGRTFADWYGWYRVAVFFANVGLAALSLVGAIGCLKNPLTGRRLVTAWAFGSLALAGATIIANAIYVYLRYSRPFAYGIGQIASGADYVVSITAIPIICLVVFRRRDVRKLFPTALPRD